MSDAEKTKKTSSDEAERKANLQRLFAERAIKGKEGIWWRLFCISSRFLQNRSMGQLIVLFIVFIVVFYFLDIT